MCVVYLCLGTHVCVLRIVCVCECLEVCVCVICIVHKLLDFFPSHKNHDYFVDCCNSF